jgi:hypothetical protein
MPNSVNYDNQFWETAPEEVVEAYLEYCGAIQLAEESGKLGVDGISRWRVVYEKDGCMDTCIVVSNDYITPEVMIEEMGYRVLSVLIADQESTFDGNLWFENTYTKMECS